MPTDQQSDARSLNPGDRYTVQRSDFNADIAAGQYTVSIVLGFRNTDKPTFRDGDTITITAGKYTITVARQQPAAGDQHGDGGAVRPGDPCPYCGAEFTPKHTCPFPDY